MKKKPNILVIMADDLGCCDLGCYGNTMADTPNIDRLAADGVVLSHHYSASPMCAPARAGFLTGRYPHRTGATDVPSIRGMNRVDPSLPTLPGILRSHGYRTGLVGKWHNGGGHSDFHPSKYGYDEFFGFEGGVSPYFDYYTECAFGDLTHVTDRYITDLLTDEAVGFIERNRDCPFQLQVSYNAPHRPLEAPDEDIAVFEKYDCLTRGLKILYAMVRRMDAGIGRILDCLESNGLTENTVVLFVSDNGPDFVGSGDMAIKDRPFHDFCGHKGEVYDGGIRVPAIIRLPGTLSGGVTVREPSCFTDWLPTLTALVGIGATECGDTDGRDILPLLTGKSLPETDYFWHWTRYEPVNRSNMAVLHSGFKLVYPVYGNNNKYYKPDSPFSIMYGSYKILLDPIPREHPGSDFKPLLFNLRDDPGETRDISEEYPEKVAELDAILEKWFRKVMSDYACAAAHTLVNPEDDEPVVR